jgi:hypothetical protein
MIGSLQALFKQCGHDIILHGSHSETLKIGIPKNILMPKYPKQFRYKNLSFPNLNDRVPNDDYHFH